MGRRRSMEVAGASGVGAISSVSEIFTQGMVYAPCMGR